jgi:hypothetical protein
LLHADKHDKAKGRISLSFRWSRPPPPKKKQIQRRSGIQLNNVYIKFNLKTVHFLESYYSGNANKRVR